ncbi:hypothetical protein G6F40_017647 [Rhizopus arrhizus]|nr:hypothetical protein G6F40_017647 [Rhizopus arrhizus]
MSVANLTTLSRAGPCRSDGTARHRTRRARAAPRNPGIPRCVPGRDRRPANGACPGSRPAGSPSPAGSWHWPAGWCRRVRTR